VKAFDIECPTVSVTAPNKPFYLICGSDDPSTPDSADIMAECGQDHPLFNFSSGLKFSYT